MIPDPHRDPKHPRNANPNPNLNCRAIIAYVTEVATVAVEDARCENRDLNTKECEKYSERLLSQLIAVGVSSVFTCVELGALYYTEYRAVIRLTDMVGMKLSPMDTEKAHIAGALVRSILELGHPSESRFGIDPKQKAQASKRKWCKYFTTA